MYVVADIGGTNTRVAASADLQKFDEPVIVETPQEYEAGVGQIIEAAERVAKGARIEALSIGLPGSFDRGRRTLLKTEHLPKWHGKKVPDDLEKALSTKAYAENDAALVALGETHFGAGAGADIVVYMTVSTGVGGARIVRGGFDTTVFGSEIGGQYLFHDGRFVTFEELISGSAVEKKYKKHPKELGFEHPVWEELAEITAFGLYNSILHWSPERVVLGGSMFNEIGIPVEGVARHLARINKKYPVLPEIVHSALGDLGGLYGGLARLKALRAQTRGTGDTLQRREVSS